MALIEFSIALRAGKIVRSREPLYVAGSRMYISQNKKNIITEETTMIELKTVLLENGKVIVHPFYGNYLQLRKKTIRLMLLL